MGQLVSRRSILTLARLVTQLENGTVPKKTVTQLNEARHKSFLIGITGAAGAGKSTLCAQLIRHLKRPHRKIAFIGCDPSSPYSGGAFLGDRIRMGNAAAPNVFIRSMATRGHLGGLARATAPACGAMARAGFDPILVESVGAGQTDVAISRLVDLVVMVLTPDFGDSIQLSKAGVLETADVFVINKADHPYAARAEQSLHSMLATSNSSKPVFKTVATRGMGMGALVNLIEDRARRTDRKKRPRKGRR